MKFEKSQLNHSDVFFFFMSLNRKGQQTESGHLTSTLESTGYCRRLSKEIVGIPVVRSFYRKQDGEGYCLGALLRVVMNVAVLIRKVRGWLEEQVRIRLLEGKQEEAIFVLRSTK